MAEKEQNERYKRFIRPGEEDPDLGIFMDAVVEDGKAWIEAQKNYTILLGSEKLGKLCGMPMALRVQEERLARLTTSKINAVIHKAQDCSSPPIPWRTTIENVLRYTSPQ